jgi:hypothetical protein
MNENLSPSTNLDQLKGLARHLESNPDYMAWALREYLHQERLDEEKLAAMLNVNSPMLTRLSLCKRPVSASPAFAGQVRQLSEYVGIDASILANLLHQVETLSALLNIPTPTPEAKPRPAILAWRNGFLAAARDRAEESEEAEHGCAEESDRHGSGDVIEPKHVD